MRITVTKEDIFKGIRADCSGCPIALAARRKFFGEVDVFAGHIWTQSGSYRLPQVALDFIQKFDTGKKAKPFEFEARRVKPFFVPDIRFRDYGSSISDLVSPNRRRSGEVDTVIRKT